MPFKFSANPPSADKIREHPIGVSVHCLLAKDGPNAQPPNNHVNDLSSDLISTDSVLSIGHSITRAYTAPAYES